MSEISERKTTSGLASEGGHWYRRDGSACYEIMAKTTGKMRPVTLRDARELGLVPGVTGVNKLLDKGFALKPYWQTKMGEAVMANPILPGETMAEYMARMMQIADEHAATARDTGTLVHGAFEQSILGQPFDPQWSEHVAAMRYAIDHKCGVHDWWAEHSFAHPRGYGCKLDMVLLEGDGMVVDHKGKEGPLEGVKTYLEHWMQLAAGRRAARIPQARCFINYFRRDQPEANCIEVTEEQLTLGLAAFDCLLDLWKVKSRYDSGWQE